MPQRPSTSRRVGTVMRWPLGMAFTAWRYLWRVTVLHRVDDGQPPDPVTGPALSTDRQEGLQPASDGVGPLFHRRYHVRVADPVMSAHELMSFVAEHPDRAAPREVALFWKTRGEGGPLQVGDEFIVRMPGPWDGPVRVVDRTPTSFRLATLQGHLEAGQIEFRAYDDDGLHFEIESWTTSGDHVSHLLYSRIRIIKEMQLHMWAHYCERIPSIAGGRLVDGLEIHTGRIDEPFARS